MAVAAQSEPFWTDAIFAVSYNAVYSWIIYKLLTLSSFEIVLNMKKAILLSV